MTPEDSRQGGSEQRTLVVLLPGIGSWDLRWLLKRRRPPLSDIADAVAEAIPRSDVLSHPLPRNPFARADAFDVAMGVVKAIDEQERKRPHGTIVLIGHSMGALVARKVTLLANGALPEAPFEKPCEARGWASRIDRLILLAGTNRGWTISSTMGRGRALASRALLALASALRLGTYLRAGRQGSPFVTELRIQWLALARSRPGPPLTVQLLGTVDDVVSPDDNVDLQTGADFVYLDVPETGHLNVRDFSGPAGAERKRIFLKALVEDPQALKAAGAPVVIRTQQPDPSVRNVVFVLHGIRDRGFWTARLARTVKRIGDAHGESFTTITSTYGYFPMGAFLLHFRRQKNVRWFMDQYTEALALYPNASFSVVGHSNGTYLLAAALAQYKAVPFRRVAFAGSVVRSDYDWAGLLASGRVAEIRNFVADADAVVAVFPRLFERLRLSDIGGAGFDGFVLAREARLQGFSEYAFVPGGHGIVVQERYWDDVAEFIVRGDAAPAIQTVKTVRRWVLWCARFSLAIWLALLCFVLLPFAWLIAGGANPLGLVAALVFWIAILLVLTRY